MRETSGPRGCYRDAQGVRFGARPTRTGDSRAGKRPEERPEHETWATDLAKALSDGTTAAAYVGFVGDEGEEGVRCAYPAATLERLAQVKRRHDPDDLFRLNPNVPPDVKW